jgi:T3SS negative regulator,GrlR
MLDGLWTAEFGSSTGMFGSGVAVFADGKILGGDNLYYYTGEYKLQGNALQATRRYAHVRLLKVQKAYSKLLAGS